MPLEVESALPDYRKVFVLPSSNRNSLTDYFVIPDGEELTEKKLASYLKKFNTKCKRYEYLNRAYRTDYDVFYAPPKPRWKPDNRLAVNFAKYLVDTFGGFFIGNPIKVYSDDKRVSEYVNFLDAYNMQDDNNSELSKIMDIFGNGYEMYYVDEDGKICITYLNPMEAFMIYDDSIVPKPRYFVHVYRDNNNIVRGSLSDERSIWYFTYNGGKVVFKDEEKLHGFDGVPAVEYVENAERMGLFESVMSLINEYNKAISEKGNDVDAFADAYLKILGAHLEEQDLKHIRDDRIINFDGVEDGNLVVEFMNKPSDDETQEHLLDRLEKLIFKISMVVDITNEEFGNASGISLKYKMLPMSNLAKTKERKFNAGMNRRYKLIFSNPMSGMNPDDWTKIKYVFSRNFPNNLLEETEIAENLDGVVSKKTQLSVLSIVDDVDAELALIAEESKGTEEKEVSSGSENGSTVSTETASEEPVEGGSPTAPEEGTSEA